MSQVLRQVSSREPLPGAHARLGLLQAKINDACKALVECLGATPSPLALRQEAVTLVEWVGLKTGDGDVVSGLTRLFELYWTLVAQAALAVTQIEGSADGA